MKKRVLIIVAAIVCALSCVVGLVACGGGDAKIDMFYVGDGVNTEPSGGDPTVGNMVGEGVLDGNTFTLTLPLYGTAYKFVATFAG